MTDALPLTLKWKIDNTIGRDDLFHAYDAQRCGTAPAGQICRAMNHTPGALEEWDWQMTAPGFQHESTIGRFGSWKGREATPRKAAHEVEQAYQRFLDVVSDEVMERFRIQWQRTAGKWLEPRENGGA